MERDLTANMDIGPFTHPTYSAPAGEGTPDVAAWGALPVVEGDVSRSTPHLRCITYNKQIHLPLLQVMQTFVYDNLTGRSDGWEIHVDLLRAMK